MSILTILPTKDEYARAFQDIVRQGFQVCETHLGRLTAAQIPELCVTLVQGGLGKVQFAVTTQHVLDAGIHWDLVMCAGAAGSLVDNLAVGDVVVATSTIEHDFNNRFGKRRIPKYDGDPAVITMLQENPLSFPDVTIHFGPIASGDEDIIDADRRRAIHQITGALAVAWEGIGGAKACAFSRVPFIEIRGITDAANHCAAKDFQRNLAIAMQHVTEVVIHLAKRRREICPKPS